jgi:hypothetical protein
MINLPLSTAITPWRWARRYLAIVLALFLCAIIPGSAGRVVADHSTTPPTHHVVGQFRDSVIAIGLVLLSVAFVFLGTWKHWSFEIVGWLILAFFYYGVIMVFF